MFKEEKKTENLYTIFSNIKTKLLKLVTGISPLHASSIRVLFQMTTNHQSSWLWNNPQLIIKTYLHATPSQNIAYLQSYFKKRAFVPVSWNCLYEHKELRCPLNPHWKWQVSPSKIADTHCQVQVFVNKFGNVSNYKP